MAGGVAAGVGGGGGGGETASGGASRQSGGSSGGVGGGGPASNWMTLVTPADSPDEANLLSISTGDEVRTTSNQGLMTLGLFLDTFLANQLN